MTCIYAHDILEALVLDYLRAVLFSGSFPQFPLLCCLFFNTWQPFISYPLPPHNSSDLCIGTASVFRLRKTQVWIPAQDRIIFNYLTSLGLSWLICKWSSDIKTEINYEKLEMGLNSATWNLNFTSLLAFDLEQFTFLFSPQFLPLYKKGLEPPDHGGGYPMGFKKLT